MKKERYSAAVFAARSLIGREIATILRDRAMPLATVRLLDDVDAGDDPELDDDSGIEPSDSDVGGVDLAFLAADRDSADLDAERLAAAGAVVIDCSDRFALQEDVPAVVPEANATQAASFGRRRLLASPDPVAVALAVVLDPFYRETGIERVVATTFEAVSDMGYGGIEELSRQATALLNGHDVEAAVFRQRICFNVLPGEEAADSPAELSAAAQLRKVLESPELEISLSRVRVPAFYGTGISLGLQLRSPLDPEAAKDLLRDAPGVLLADGMEHAGSSLADAVGQDGVLVGRIRADRSVEAGLNLWVAIDNVRKGRALNAVQIAEILLRDVL